MIVRASKLGYTERSGGKYRDLRQLELRFRGRFVRLSLNGQYRSGKFQYDATRYANPGWSVGTEQVLINWCHFKCHCWHLSFEAFRRGVTLSYGRSLF